MAKDKPLRASSYYLHFTLVALFLFGLFWSALLVTTQLEPLLALFFAVNLTGFILMGYDKNAAHHRRVRVPEFVILTIALFGGSPAILVAVHTFRHKTLKARFQLGLLVYFIIQLLTVRALEVSFWQLFTP